MRTYFTLLLLLGIVIGSCKSTENNINRPINFTLITSNSHLILPFVNSKDSHALQLVNLQNAVLPDTIFFQLQKANQRSSNCIEVWRISKTDTVVYTPTPDYSCIYIDKVPHVSKKKTLDKENSAAVEKTISPVPKTMRRND